MSICWIIHNSQKLSLTITSSTKTLNSLNFLFVSPWTTYKHWGPELNTVLDPLHAFIRTPPQAHKDLLWTDADENNDKN